ncbi:RmrB protein [Novosphingobium sp. Rr 2-17]|uniref:DHA2 family efflux MFS transporter permease subunit n=1 Tax=Novosphingobium sp. Rr 2-17 TaxID=555793 RepID=UPI0002697E4A|nr:DHA2 family efflux MFS transporter permease subunit [Novosphingobium sp. Rr 2-17]EIZ80741.1 RmrB protein [Novosphingobium sp. Rr 2-17]
MAVAAGTIGSLMATLDTSIVNAALPTIQGEIGASQDEGTWITTAYLVAEIIMIPLAGWMVRILGLRNFLIICGTAFTGFSMMCGLSNSLIVMVIGRLGQGFTGGALIPTALTIIATRLPPSQRSSGIAIFGLVAVLGPVIGPILGGYLTETLSWHYAFFINLPIGIGLVALVIATLPDEEKDLGLFFRADWLSVIGMTLFLGALTVVLEEGLRERWFESTFIIKLSIASAVGFIILVWGQLTAREPVIRMGIIFQRAFGSVFFLSLLVGAALYGISYMLPQFLAQLHNYNSLQSGEVTLLLAIPSVLMMGVFPLLVRKVDIRILVAAGFVFYAVGCNMNAYITQETSGQNFIVPLLVIGLGQFLALIFLNQAAASSVSEHLAEDASGLFNAARNLGGSIGLAVIKTVVQSRTWFHSEAFAGGMTRNAPNAQAYIQQQAQQQGGGDMVLGMGRAYASLNNTFQTMGTAYAYADMFWLFSIAMLLCIPFAFLLRPLPNNAEIVA